MKTKFLIACLILATCSNCKDNSKAKEVKLYFENGSLKSIGYEKDGKHTGKYIEYYPNGNLKFEAYYKNGLQDSIQRTYTVDGKLYQTGFLKDGKLNGITETYDKSGYLHRRVNYVVVNDTSFINEFYTYDEEGNIKKDSSMFFLLESDKDTINQGESYFLKVKLEATAFNVKPNMKVVIENNEVMDTLSDVDDNKRDLTIIYKTNKYKIGENLINGQIMEYVLYYNQDSSVLNNEMNKMWFNKTFYVVGNE